MHRAWAEEQLRAVENGTAEHDPGICGLQALCLNTDVPAEGAWPPEDLLPRLVENNATNRMAFEYLAAQLLLSFKLEQFIRELEHMKPFYGSEGKVVIP